MDIKGTYGMCICVLIDGVGRKISHKFILGC